MATIHIHLFGRFEIYVGKRELRCFRSQKALELFCYLLLFRDQPHHREQVAEIFWGERCTSEAKKYLRKTLWQLQSSLERLPGSDQAKLIRAKTDWLQFNCEGEIWLDVLEFESACRSLSGTRGRDFNAGQFQIAKTSMGLYRGDLLEGCYHDWCIYERERLKDMFLVLVDKLMSCCEACQDFESGILYGRKLLVLDGARESTHLRLMRLYYFAGDRTRALRQFETCRDALQKEFEIEPGEKLMDLRRQLLSDSFGDLISNADSDLSKLSDHESIPDINTSLSKIRELLALQATIPDQIMGEIQAIEEILSKKE